MKLASSRRIAGFSMLEALITVFAVGALSALAIGFTGTVRENTKQQKLEQDVKAVNSAISIFLSNGGNLDGVTDPQEILDRMKTEQVSSAKDQFVGLTGSTVDPRLAAAPISQNPPRWGAVWNPATKKFEIRENPTEGIAGFVLDESLADVDYGSSKREQSSLVYNEKPGWIWAYEDKPVTNAEGPPSIPVSTPPNTPPRPAPKKLAPPVFGTPAGAYPEKDFPLSIEIANPNDPSTILYVSIDGGSYGVYSGPISVNTDTLVTAYVTGDPLYWIKSDKRYAPYSVIPPPDPVQLAPPVIQLSSDTFDDTIPEIAVSISNPNPDGSSSLFYSIVLAGLPHPPKALWLPYNGAFAALSDTFPSGFEIVSYAKSSDPELFIDSPDASAMTRAEFFEIPITQDILFIVDASGSMDRSFGSETRFEATIRELIRAIETLPASIRFNVAMFDKGNHWTDGTFTLHPATPENKETLVSQIEQVETGSGTNYSAALAFPTMFDPIPKQVILLSDGQPNDNRYTSLLEDLASRDMRIDTIGLDIGGNAASVLQDIADQTGGILYLVSEP